MGFDALAKALASIGKTPRLRLLALLMAFEEPLCVCELSSGLGLPEYETSRHLAVLKRAGLVASDRDGLWAYYRLADGPVGRALHSMLRASGEDLARLQARLRQRVAGRCVVGPDTRGSLGNESTGRRGLSTGGTESGCASAPTHERNEGDWT